MSNPTEGREIWFLTGSQGLYGEDTLRQVAEQSREVADTVAATGDVPVRIVWKPVLTDASTRSAAPAWRPTPPTTASA